MSWLACSGQLSREGPILFAAGEHFPTDSCDFVAERYNDDLAMSAEAAHNVQVVVEQT